MHTDAIIADEAIPDDESTGLLFTKADEAATTLVATVITMVECKRLDSLSDRVKFEYDMALIAMCKRVRFLCGNDPAANREYLGGDSDEAK